MQSYIIFVLTLLFLLVNAQSHSLEIVRQCYNQFDQYCVYKFSIMNCESSSVSYTYNIVNSQGTNVDTGSSVALTGWQNGGNFVCATNFGGLSNFPWTVSVTVSGTVITSTSWDGCQNTTTSCSPAGFDCVYSNTHTSAPSC